MIQTIWTSVPHHTKYKLNPGYKAVYNCTMPYLIILVMTSIEFSEDLENEQINS